MKFDKSLCKAAHKLQRNFIVLLCLFAKPVIINLFWRNLEEAQQNIIYHAHCILGDFYNVLIPVVVHLGSLKTPMG